MSRVDPKHTALCKSGPESLSSPNKGNTLRDSKGLFADKRGVASYHEGALARNLAVEVAYGPYLFANESTGGDGQSAGDTGLLVRY